MLLRAMLKNPQSVAREMDRLFDSMMSSQSAAIAPAMRSSLTFPALNVWEDDDHYFAEAELPGISMDDIEVYITGSELTIKGARHAKAPDNARALRRERSMGEFERTLTLPKEIDADNVEASVNNGVLTIKLPKAVETKPRRISVQAS